MSRPYQSLAPWPKHVPLRALLGAATLAGSALLYNNSNTEAETVKPDLKFKFVIVGAGVAAKACLNTLSTLNSDPLPESSGYNGKVTVWIFFCLGVKWARSHDLLQVFMVGNENRLNSINLTENELVELGEVSDDSQNKIEHHSHVAKLNVVEKTVLLDDGTVIGFDKCFIATGKFMGWGKNDKGWWDVC